MSAGVIVALVFVAIFLVVQIIRWIVATVGLGKAVVDGVKKRNVRQTEDEQFHNLTSGR